MERSPREFVKWGLENPDVLRADPELAAAFMNVTAQAQANPLVLFDPHSDPQREFVEAATPVVAAFAGNRFGKSTVLAVCALREALDADMLPPILARTKRFTGRTAGWIVVPSEAKIFDAGGFQEVFEKWTPKSALRGGSWGKAFNGSRLTLSFENGSSISFKTYQQDPSTLGGAALHWVGFDEPPPRKHRQECMMRLADYGGYEMFAMTPLESNTGYVRREIWKKRASPDITVVKGSIHDNPTLDRATVKRVLEAHTDIWRQAREFGDFVDMGGQMYPDFERCVAKAPFDPEFIRGLDVVVGIDPGIRNAGIVWVGFDRDLSAYVFNEGILQDKEAHEYAKFIKAENSRLGLGRVRYVCDPAMRSRGQVTTETVMSALAKEGIYANAGQNDHHSGFDQLRTRMRLGRFHVDPRCVGLRDEADEYVAKEPDEGKDDSYLEPVGGNDHRLDAMRYAVMERFWDPRMEANAPSRNLGWVPDRALDMNGLNVRAEQIVGPMGQYS